MKLTPLQTIIYALFFLTVILTVASLLWFWIDQPFKAVQNCEGTKALRIPVYDLDTPGNISVRPVQGACTISPAKDLSSTHNLIINSATATGILFLIVSGYAYATRKKEPDELE